MFSSTRISDAGLLYRSDKDNSLDETTNKSFLKPKITSTPLRRESIFATPPKPRILSPRRYSLSEVATPPRSSRRDLSISNSYRNAPGPLLASTKFNVNVSTYEDTKTPGLAGRIVQYNEEAEQEKEYRRHPTHQAQYGTVGLFPIVHLFKKKLPLLQKKPKHVTVRIASPDYARQHTQEYNRKLLEDIVKPGGGGFGFLQSKNKTTSTRNVLDALKEISRKRMHTSEELEVYEESGKRLRTDNSDNEEAPEGNKRQRDDSPLETSPSPSRQTSKKICMYDEYAASCSSMDYKKLEPLIPKRKLVSISTLTDNPKESKQVKLINVETQTAQEAQTDNSANTKPKIHEQTETDVDESLIKSSESAIKVFDDTPLERIRTNRLAALLGSLAGKDAMLSPKPNASCALNGETTESSILNTTDKPLVSILSTPNKSPHKTDRHVHFSIPESTHQTTGTFSSLTSISSSTTDLVNISSSAGSQTVSTTRSAAPIPLSPVNLVPTSTAVSSSTTLGTPEFSFGATVSKDSTVNSSKALVSKEPALNPTANIAFSKPSAPTVASTSLPVPGQLNFPLTASSSPPKMGGFKFDLNKPTSAAVSSPNVAQSVTNSSLLFPSPQKPKSQGSPFGSAPTSVVSPTFSFGSKLAAPTTSSTPATLPNAASIISTIASTSATPSFNFTTSKNNDSTGTSTANKTNIVSLFSPGSATTSVTDASKTSAFSFGSTTQATRAPFTFGAQKADTATSPTSVAAGGFGGSTGFTVTSAPSSLVPNFPASTPFSGTTLNLSQVDKPGTTSASTFGNTSTSIAAPLFGSTSASTATPFGSNPVFGQSTTQASFVAPSTTSSFSASNAFGSTNPSTTASFMFAGSNNVSGTAPKIFGGTAVTQATGFGGPTVTQASSFGTTTVTQTPGFGAPVVTQAAGFGAPTTNSLFGTSTGLSFGGSTVTTASSAFGSTTPTFTFGPKTNSTTSVGFGTPTTTSSFGAPTGTGFGSTTGQTAAFGAMNSAASGFGGTTSTSSGFGAAASTGVGFGTTTSVNAVAPTFGAANSFGSGSTFAQNNAFGGSAGTANNSSFGTVPTTQPSAFGATSPPSFGSAATTQAGSFAKAAAPTFGGFGTPSKDSAFGSTPAASFGAPAQPAVFGATTSNAPSFGAAGSAFGKPQSATTNMFGGTSSSNPVSNAFGGSNAFATNQQQGTGGFGTTNTAANPGAAFSFSAAPNQTVTKQSGVFSFGGATAASGDKSKFNFNAASTAPPSFGSTSAPAFGSTSTPFGGAATPSFGGTATPSFGGTAPSSFSGTAPPSFGSTVAPSFGAAAQPSFGAAQPTVPGTFSIGSGSSASGRPRTQIKAKRRT